MINFHSLQQVIDEASERHCSIAELAIEYECDNNLCSVTYIRDTMAQALKVMRHSRSLGLQRQEKSFSGLTGAEAYQLMQKADTKHMLIGEIGRTALAGALAVAQMNAAMGKVVATPTAGSCGILPGALLAVADAYNYDEDLIITALLTAAGVGLPIAYQAYIAGASGGCQAECGTASAMTAAAIVEMLGGSPEQAGHAAALAIKSIMGLVCDPVAGLVEIPCIKRNGFGAVQALTAAELALAGIKSSIPIDEVILAMKEVGDNLPACYKETAKGGLATTPTGLLLKDQVFKPQS